MRSGGKSHIVSYAPIPGVCNIACDIGTVETYFSFGERRYMIGDSRRNTDRAFGCKILSVLSGEKPADTAIFFQDLVSAVKKPFFFSCNDIKPVIFCGEGERIFCGKFLYIYAGSFHHIFIGNKNRKNIVHSLFCRCTRHDRFCCFGDFCQIDCQFLCCVPFRRRCLFTYNYMGNDFSIVCKAVLFCPYGKCRKRDKKEENWNFFHKNILFVLQGCY